MSNLHSKPVVIFASLISSIFVAIAVVLWSPIAINTLSRGGETNGFFLPYLEFMAATSLANALIILAIVPLSLKVSGRIPKIVIWSAVILSTFIFAELGAAAIVNKVFGRAHVGSRFTNGFEYSPSMGYVLKPDFRFDLDAGLLTHTSEGYRGPVAPSRQANEKKTFVLIGGSSTYDLGLPDEQTWSSNLGAILSDRIRVLNLGIPGHSTAEHVTLAALVAWKYRPDVMVYYIGWNDIRSSHLNESTDYSHFHKKKMLRSFAVTEPTAFFALSYVLKKLVSVVDETSLYRLTEVRNNSELVEPVDEKLLRIYLHNVRILAAISREIGATPVFVPQIMNVHRLTSDQSYGWIPTVPQRAIPEVLAVFNQGMIEVARSQDAVVLHEVLDIDWQDSDFVDRGHFSRNGAKRFACVLAKGLLERGVIEKSATIADGQTDKQREMCAPSGIGTL